MRLGESSTLEGENVNTNVTFFLAPVINRDRDYAGSLLRSVPYSRVRVSGSARDLRYAVACGVTTKSVSSVRHSLRLSRRLHAKAERHKHVRRFALRLQTPDV